MTKEALTLALEALEEYHYGEARIILRQALAQPEQELVATYTCGVCGVSMQMERPWVGLTNNELQPIADEYRILFGSWVEDFARAIEAKLKEKNA